MRRLFTLVLLAAAIPAYAGVLIVADEVPAMETLAKKLRAEGVSSEIVDQTRMPSSLAGYEAVFVYIHRDIVEPAEKAFIAYAENGGKLILLHHSISSGKRKNRYWLPFLGVSLPTGDFAAGGYKYIEDISFQAVNLAPDHFITGRGVKYDASAEYRGAVRPALDLHESEVYLNHVFTEPRTILMGVKFRDPQSGKIYVQDSAAWLKRAGKGWVLYFMPGHSVKEFENPGYAQILANAVKFKPEASR